MHYSFLPTVIACVSVFASRLCAQPVMLRTADATLDFPADAAGQRPRVSDANAACAAPAAAAIFVLTAENDATRRFDVAYRSVRRAGDGTVVAVATLATPAGSTVEVVDTWSADEGVFAVARVVTVARAATGDRAFGTGLEFAAPSDLISLADADVFIPGLWYATAAHTPPSGLIHDVGQSDFLLRADRMALPLVSLRDRRSGHTLTLAQPRPDGATIAADDALDRLIDGRLRFASLGLRREPGRPPRVAFRFPGTEGEQTGIFGYKPARRTVERLHPLTPGGTQRYELTIRLSRHDAFPDQMRRAWRDAYAAARPPVVPFDAKRTYDASLNVLDHYAYEEDGPHGLVAGFGFSARIPDGTQRDRSLQMGFVGQQLPCATYLIDEGLRSKRRDLVAQGERIVDFWARESLSAQGVPRTWFDVDPAPHRWRNYETYLRVATDGTSGALRAWQLMRTAGHDRPRWLAFCRAVGDWLITSQNPDGSWPRSFAFDGTPKSASKTGTLHPVRLLVDLSCATGDEKYRDAAIRAADFALKANADGATHVGGTPDNPDVKDKEAGWIAFDSYLALYDVTRDERHLDAAVAAATFTETWVYAWSPPMPVDSTKVTIPQLKTYAGAASLIATGHSGSDVFLAYASLSYARLSIYTGDDHFADVARLLQANTAQLVDAGQHGYAVRGLLVEAFTLAVNRGTSVRAWLPWGTSAILEPMARCRETFGTIDVAEALQLDAAERTRRNAAWGRTRGFAPP